MNRKFQASPELSGLAAYLVRLANTMMASTVLGNAEIHRFLQELGVVQPWENRVPYDDKLLLPVAEHSRSLLALAKAAANFNAKGLEDTMQDLRTDWKDMTVFCIDNVGAKEIDDGVSLERIEGLDEYWIHIHIANPTAFLSPESDLSKMASHLGESLYFPERNWPMLPPSITQQYFSLASDRPVLTFSVRLNGQGDIIDKKIRNGTIRNVITVNWSQLNHTLGYSDTTADVVLTVGKVPEHALPKPKELNLTEEHIEDLKTLEILARKRSALRPQIDGKTHQQNMTDIAVYTHASGPGIPLSLPSRKVARYFSGDPTIQLRGKGLISAHNSADDTSVLVTEMMLMCCEVAAAWASERALPVLYRGTVDNPNLEDRETFIEKHIKPLTENNLPVPLLMIKKLRRLGGGTVLSSKPLPHSHIGAACYTRATSPLRRYGDMVTHWQIESALREEARIGKSLDKTFRPQQWLAFPHGAIKDIARRLLSRERLITRAKGHSHQHWITHLFFRAFYFGQAKLKDELTVVLSSANPSNPWIEANIIEYGCRCTMYEPKDYGFGWDGQFGSGEAPPEVAAKASQIAIHEGSFGWRTGDTWAVAIDRVDPFVRAIFVKPLRLISREIPIV